MKRLCMAGRLSFILLLLNVPVWASDIQTQPVQFTQGKSVATIKGALKGHQIIDYSLLASAGQTMRVSFKTSNASAYFNVLPPGSAGEAIFVGAMSGDQWTGTLVSEGEYRIRTYLYRDAARRNESVRLTLTISVTGNAASTENLGTAPAGDAKVAGTPYHATGVLPCSVGTETPGGNHCKFGIIRGNPGHAEVHVTFLCPG